MAHGDWKSLSKSLTAAHFALVVLLAGPTFVNASETLLLDTFDDDIVGETPNGPEVGSYLEIAGNHVVVDPGSGDLALFTTGDGISEGPILRYGPADSPNSFTVEFELLISGTSFPVGQNAFSQTLDFTGCSIEIGWADDGEIYLAVAFFAGVIIHETSFVWLFDSDYLVTIDIDSSLNTLSLTVNSSTILQGQQLPVEIGELIALTFGINEETAGAQILDRVIIVDESILFRDDFESGDLSAWYH